MPSGAEVAFHEAIVEALEHWTQSKSEAVVLLLEGDDAMARKQRT